jgi:hypothetical protein
MIAEALKFLSDLGATAAGTTNKATILKVDDKVRYLVEPSGCTELDPTIPARNHQLLSIAEFPAFVRRWHENVATEISVLPSIWLSAKLAGSQTTAGQVTAVLDDSWDSLRDDRVTCPLTFMPEFMALRDLSSGRGIDQKSMRNLLRNTLADCNVPQFLIDWVSKINWTKNRSANAEISRGKVSLGADVIQQALSEAGEMPEMVILLVRVFDDPALPERRPIACLFDADADTQTLSLVPRGNGLQAEFDAALEDARALLTSQLTDVPVYLGHP